jgi:hypothetical protein
MFISKIRSRSVRVIALAFAIVSFGLPNFGQPRQTKADINIPEKLSLLAEIQSLASRAKQLDRPLARAMAEAEVADAAWFIDRDLAKQLLRDSSDLSSPDEAEQSKLRNRPVGSPSRVPAATGKARWNIRRRIMDVARRDKPFADELVQALTEKLGPSEGHQTFASLAGEAINQGDIDAGSKYIRRAIDADPTLVNASTEIGRLAIKDRAAADQAIVEYIDRLRSVSL